MGLPVLPIIALASAALVSSVALSPNAQAAGLRYSPPSSINASCSRDVSSALQTWLDSVPDGASANEVNTIDLRSGCYLLNGRDPLKTGEGMKLVGRQNLRIVGDGATLRTSIDVPRHPDRRAHNRAQLTLVENRNVTIDGLTFKGYAPRPGIYESRSEFDHNLRVLGGSGITITDITADKAQGDNVYIGSSPDGRTRPTSVSLTGSSLSNAQRHNVSVTMGTNITVDDNTMDVNGAWALNAEMHTKDAYLNALSFSRNTVDDTRMGIISVTSRTDSVAGVDGVLVRDNTMLKMPVSRIEPVLLNGYPTDASAPMKNVTVSGNLLMARQYGLSVKSVQNLQVISNRGSTWCDTALDSPDRLHALTASKGRNSTMRVADNVFIPARPGLCKTTPYAQIIGSSATTRLTMSSNISE